MKIGLEVNLDVAAAEKRLDKLAENFNKKAFSPSSGSVKNAFYGNVPTDVRRKFPGMSPSEYSEIMSNTKRMQTYFERVRISTPDPKSGALGYVNVAKQRVVSKSIYEGLSASETVAYYKERQERAAKLRALRASGGVETPNAAESVNELAKSFRSFPSGNNNKIKSAFDATDISLKKLLRSFSLYTTGYLGLRTLYEGVQSFVASGSAREQSMFSNSIAYGSRGAADKAYMQALNGGLPFEAQDFMSGNTSLMRIGIKGSGSQSMVSNMSGRLGQGYSETASDIVAAIGGDTQILTKYGLKQSDLRGLNKYQGNSPRMKSAVMGLLGRGDIKKQFEHGLTDFKASWIGTMNQLENNRKGLWATLIGDPNDQNSLWGTVKATFTKINKWFEENRVTMARFVSFVSRTLSWTWSKVEAVAKKIGSAFKGFLDLYFKSEKSFERFTKRMLLGLEIVYQKTAWFVNNFPLTALGAVLMTPKFLGTVQMAGSLSAKAFLRGFLAVGIGAELGQYLTNAFNTFKNGGTYKDLNKSFTENGLGVGSTKDANVAKLLEAYRFSESGLSPMQNTKAIISDVFGFSKDNAAKGWQTGQAETARKMLRDPSISSAIKQEIFNQMYNYGAQTGQGNITIQVQGNLIGDEANIKRIADTILRQQQVVSKRMGGQ